MKVIISTGQGRLHLIDSAQALLKSGAKCSVITGWVPVNTPKWIVVICGKILGRGENLYASMMKRCPDGVPFDLIKSCSMSEFIHQALYLLAGKRLLSQDRAVVLGWKLYGFASKSYICDADVFHVRSGAGHGGAIALAKKKGMKVVVDHSIAHPAEVFRQLTKVTTSDRIGIQPARPFWKMVLKDCADADVIVVNSHYVKKSFVDEGWNESCIRVIPLGIREDFIALKDNYSSDGPFRLLFTGYFGIRKGAHLLVEMSRQLEKKGFKFILDIVGNIEDKDKLPEWFLTSKNIFFHGHVLQDDLKQFLKISDAYIFPTYAEGAAQSVKEAMAAGLPVITTLNSGAPIHHSVNGWIVPVHDVTAMMNAVIAISHDETLRHDMGVAATKTIQAEHTWPFYANTLNGLYSELGDEC